jgi:hypothetical protein
MTTGLHRQVGVKLAAIGSVPEMVTRISERCD